MGSDQSHVKADCLETEARGVSHIPLCLNDGNCIDGQINGPVHDATSSSLLEGHNSSPRHAKSQSKHNDVGEKSSPRHAKSHSKHDDVGAKSLPRHVKSHSKHDDVGEKSSPRHAKSHNKHDDIGDKSPHTHAKLHSKHDDVGEKSSPRHDKSQSKHDDALTDERDEHNRKEADISCLNIRDLMGIKCETSAEKQEKATFLLIRHQHLKEMELSRPAVTDRQSELILESWTILQRDLTHVGHDMFLRLFESYPAVKGTFMPFRAVPEGDIKYTLELAAHGTRVLNTLHDVIMGRQDREWVVNHLHSLGQKHLEYNAKIDYIDILGQHFLFAAEPVLKDHWTPEVEEAWADLFKLISHIMKEAMLL